LQDLIAIARRHNLVVFADEIYDRILYDGAEHVSIATLPEMRERAVTVNSLSKTYSVTGWRVGYCIAPAEITNAIRKVHDFLTVGAANPLQHAGAYAMNLPDSYYAQLQAEYRAKRDFIVPVLQDAGFRCGMPEGAYYVMTDISGFNFADDIEFTKHMIREIGVAVVPGSSFYYDKSLGSQKVRFCFCKRDETLEAAAERLQKLKKG
jgi:aminotransferase